MNTPTEPVSRRRQGPTAQHPEVRIVATARQRLPMRLDHVLDDPPEDPTLQQIVAAATPYLGADGWLLDGGEATLREDFPQLLRALADAGAPDLGMVTDGLALTSPKVVTMLGQLGLKRVRIRLAGARHDAHDWLFGQKGAWRRAVKALQVCAEGGLRAEVEVTVTRPTAPYLREALDLFARLGAKAVLLRRVTARGAAANDDVALAPRFGLITGDLEDAVQSAVRSGMRVMVEGFPNCVAPNLAAHRLATDAVVWALPHAPGWSFLGPRFELPTSEPGCGRCPGRPECCAAPVDYVRRFGRTEIESESSVVFNPGKLPPAPLVGGEVYPPFRAGRFPPARLSYVRLAARLPSLAGDPLVALRSTSVSTVYRTLFVAPSLVVPAHLGDHPGPSEAEPTRGARIRLVKLAQHGAHTLRIASAGTLAHPEAADLLREATRLQFSRVEVAGEASALDGFSDMQLRRLRGISRIDVALYGPDAATHDAVMGVDGAFEAALRALERVATLVPSIEVGAYAVLQDEAHLAAFAEAWDFGDLPGEPWFRLASKGGDLAVLARAAAALPEGPARDAIAAVLPVRLLPREGVLPAPEAQTALGDFSAAFAKPSGSDKYGCYTDRPSPDREPAPGDCPGYAVGWTVDGEPHPSDSNASDRNEGA
jgi:MoaA/NifB/PqqE/SkfB family radical SAM enzyme